MIFLFNSEKIITRYRRMVTLQTYGYRLNVVQQSADSACLVFNPVMVDSYAVSFNCTPVGRASDSMMTTT